MTWLRVLAARFAALFQKQRLENEMNEELSAHLDMLVEENVRKGMTLQEARFAARRSFGGLEQTKEIYRETRGLPALETLFQDIRYGLRMLRNSPGFTAVAILTLALGIGANTAIFSLIDSVMLRFLPVQTPQELALVERQDPTRAGVSSAVFTNALWEQVRDQQDVFSGVFAWSTNRFDLARGGTVQYASGIFVSGGYFTTLGVRPAVGRLFSAADDQRGCPAVAVLSYGFWQDRFGGVDSALGSTVSLDQHSFQIIGVSARGFYGVDIGDKFDVAVPVCTATIFDGKNSRLDHRSWWWLNIMGRVKPGIRVEQVNARLRALSPQILAAALPQDWAPKDQQGFLKWQLTTEPASTGTSYLRSKFGQPLNILMAVAGLVLLIACANIASLMLARAATRNRELAVRKALGASRRRLIRQLLTECVMLSSAGALLGILFARWGSALLVRYISTGSTPIFLDLSLDGRVLGFSAAIAVLTGILFGVLPAFRSTRVSLTSAMKATHATEGEHRGRFRAGRWIVALQVALSLVLLVAAGLLVRSFRKLTTHALGFDRNDVLLMHANLDSAKVPPERRLATCEEIEDRLRVLPGVTSASRSIMTPVSGFEWNNFVHADTPNAPTGEASLAYFNFISPGYFATLRTPLLAGRSFDARDTKTSPQVAIINQTMARKFYSNTNPLGRTFRIEELPGKPAPSIQVVGIVKDSVYVSVREQIYPTVFFPITQIPEGDGVVVFELRTALQPAALATAVQTAVAEVNKEIPLRFHTLARQVNDSLVQDRLLAMLSAFFGGLGLLLATIGLYGTLSFLVTRRQTEFGIRRALGATPGSILRLVMRDAAVILAAGVVAGASISFLAGGLLQKMLFGLDARDTTTLVLAVGALSAVGFLAAYLPARRATKVDPMVALRYE
jgi:putative ABC transport system permease protein